MNNFLIYTASFNKIVPFLLLIIVKLFKALFCTLIFITRVGLKPTKPASCLNLSPSCSVDCYCRVHPPVPVPGAARSQVLQRHDQRDHRAKLTMAAGFFGPDGRQSLRGHREVRGQPDQPALEERIQRNQGTPFNREAKHQGG